MTHRLTVPTLTIRPPWAHLIIAGHKDVENRTWHTSPTPFVMAVHAGARVDRAAVDEHAHLLDDPDDLLTGAILGTVTVAMITRNYPSPWAEPGHHHWVLENPRRLTHPIRVTGKQGLWCHPADGELADHFRHADRRLLS